MNAKIYSTIKYYTVFVSQHITKLKNAMKNQNKEVDLFLNELNHPFRKEIELLRQLILNSNKGLTENIKWNGPNYAFNNQDRITMRIQPPSKQVQLIFHRGALKQEQPKSKLIDSHLLVWKENDRAIATFKSISDIEKYSTEISNIVRAWIEATKYRAETI